MKQIQSLLLGGAIALPQLAFAQTTGHYPIGVEGLKGATLPPPGLWLRDYNYFYYTDRLNDPDGDKVPIDFEAFAYVNAFRPVWITDVKVLGANYGCDVLVPLVYEDVKVNGVRQNESGLGDIFVEPVTLSWHWQQADASVGYGLWVPTGDADPEKALTGGVGQGHWSHMFTAGGTVYFDTRKTWSFSALGRYEIHTANNDYAGLEAGDTLSLEWGLGKALAQSVEVGVIGYWQAQTTDDSGLAIEEKDHVVAVGPEISLFCSKLGLFASLRYAYEVTAEDRPQGHTGVLTLTKKF